MLFPASNPCPRVIVAFQNPPVPIDPPVTVKPAGSPLILNNTLLGNTIPSLVSIPEPLSEVTLPDTLKDSPAIGFEAMSSITMKVTERTVTVLKLAIPDLRSDEPLNIHVAVTKPSGWLASRTKLALAKPSPVVVVSATQDSWNIIATGYPPRGANKSVASTNLALKFTVSPRLIITGLIGFKFSNCVTPKTSIDVFALPPR